MTVIYHSLKRFRWAGRPENAGVDRGIGSLRRRDRGRLQEGPARTADPEGIARLVLDANILIRAVLGSRVLALLRKYAGQVEFMAPVFAFQETRGHLPGILEARRIPTAPAMATLDLVARLVETIEAETCSSCEAIARKRIGPWAANGDRPSRPAGRQEILRSGYFPGFPPMPLAEVFHHHDVALPQHPPKAGQ